VPKVRTASTDDLQQLSVASRVTKVGEEGSCNFPTDKFQTREIMVLKSSILPLNFPKIGGFSPNFAFFLSSLLRGFLG